MARKKVTFEEALDQLETAVDALGSESLSLDESVDQFERGIKAVEQCRSALGAAEGRIVKLLEKSDGAYLEELLQVDIESLRGADHDNA